MHFGYTPNHRLHGLRRIRKYLSAAKSTSYDINSVLFEVCLLWNSLSQSIKFSESILQLKTKIKDLGNIDCSCCYVNE